MPAIRPKGHRDSKSNALCRSRECSAPSASSPVICTSCRAVSIRICLAAAAGPIRSMASSTAVGRSTTSAGLGPQSARASVSSDSISSSDLSRWRRSRPSPALVSLRDGSLGQGDVDQRSHLGQRRAQLVGGVRYEPALAGERRLQPGEHRVRKPLRRASACSRARRVGEAGRQPQPQQAARAARPPGRPADDAGDTRRRPAKGSSWYPDDCAGPRRSRNWHAGQLWPAALHDAALYRPGLAVPG